MRLLKTMAGVGEAALQQSQHCFLRRAPNLQFSSQKRVFAWEALRTVFLTLQSKSQSLSLTGSIYELPWLLQTWLFQHANASQSSNMHCGRRATSVQRLPSHLLLGSGKLALSTVVSSHKLPLLATAQSSRAFQSRQASESPSGIMLWAWMRW